MLDPVAFEIFGISIYWYGISYATGIILGFYYIKNLNRQYDLNLSDILLDKLLYYSVGGIILGGRLGYVIIYDPLKYIQYPLEILAIRNGGMSFHGGIIGVIISVLIFSRNHKIPFLRITDLISIVTPIGIFFGRIANFINGELYGRITDLPWGVEFPSDPGNFRHPSQIYEAIGEGIILFIIMKISSKNIHHKGHNTGIFILFYSIFRIICENFREPDPQIGFIFMNITLGQIISGVFLLIGLFIIRYSKCQLKQK